MDRTVSWRPMSEFIPLHLFAVRYLTYHIYGQVVWKTKLIKVGLLCVPSIGFLVDFVFTISSFMYLYKNRNLILHVVFISLW
jgi:hypothetical protein